MLDQAAHKRGELGLLPALVVRQVDVHEAQALEGMVLLDGPVQVHPAVLAGVAQDRGVFVHDSQFVAVLGHLDLVVGDDADDREERAFGLITLGTAACMIV